MHRRVYTQVVTRRIKKVSITSPDLQNRRSANAVRSDLIGIHNTRNKELHCILLQFSQGPLRLVRIENP